MKVKAAKKFKTNRGKIIEKGTELNITKSYAAELGDKLEGYKPTKITDRDWETS